MVRRHRPGLGARLRAERDAAGVLQVSLTLRLGVHKSLISQYERGMVRPRPAVPARYATVLEIDLEELPALAGYVPSAEQR